MSAFGDLGEGSLWNNSCKRVDKEKAGVEHVVMMELVKRMFSLGIGSSQLKESSGI